MFGMSDDLAQMAYKGALMIDQVLLLIPINGLLGIIAWLVRWHCSVGIPRED